MITLEVLHSLSEDMGLHLCIAQVSLESDGGMWYNNMILII